MLEHCPAYRSKGDESESVSIDDGKTRHFIVQACLNAKDETPLDIVADDEILRDQCSWALEYIGVNSSSDNPSPMTEHPITANVRGKWDVSGTADIVYLNSFDGADLFDLKSRKRNYVAQLAAYALGLFQMHDVKWVKAHAVYMVNKQVEMIRFDSAEECEAILEPTLIAASEPKPRRRQCAYCTWCRNMPSCSEWIKNVNQVAASLDGAVIPDFETLELNTTELYKAYILGKRLVKWSDSIDKLVKRVMIDYGIPVVGLDVVVRKLPYSLKEAPVNSLFNACGMPQELFLRACQARFTKNKSAQGLADVYAKMHGMPLNQAKDFLKGKFASFVPEPGTTKCITIDRAINDPDSIDSESTEQQTEGE